MYKAEAEHSGTPLCYQEVTNTQSLLLHHIATCAQRGLPSLYYITQPASVLPDACLTLSVGTVCLISTLSM